MTTLPSARVPLDEPLSITRPVKPTLAQLRSGDDVVRALRDVAAAGGDGR